MEINHFDMILGQYFLKGNKATVVPFCDEIMLIGDTWTWNLLTHQHRREVKVQHVSALSMSRVMRESDVETYARVVKEVEDDDGVGTPIPAEIFNVLAKYAYLMPD